MKPSNSTRMYIAQGIDNWHSNSCARVFMTALFTKAKDGNKLSVYEDMNGQTEWDIQIQWSITQTERGNKLLIHA